MITATAYDGPPRVELVWDEAQPGQAEQVLRTNLIENPSFTSGVDGWLPFAGVLSPTWRSAEGVAQAVGNATNTAMLIRSGYTTAWGVAPGQWLNVRARVKLEGTQTPTQALVLVAFQGIASPVVADTAEWIPDGAGWVVLDVAVQVPADATTASEGAVQVGVRLPTTAGATDVLIVDHVYVSTVQGPYFDGATPAADGIEYRWVGTPNASRSEEFLPFVAPGVSWPAGATMTITRTANQLSGTVRGATHRDATLTGFIVDWEAPVGVPITYRLDAFSPSGVELVSTSVTVAPLAEPAGSKIWLSDPLVEGSAVEVTALQGTDAERKYPQEVSRVYPAGQRYGAASVTQRRGIDEWPLVLFARTAEEALALRTMIMTAASLCVRVPAWHQLDPIMYGQFSGAEVFSPRQHNIVATWTGNLLTSGGPGLDVVVASRTYDDVLAEHETYADILVVYDAYTDLQRGQV